MKKAFALILLVCLVLGGCGFERSRLIYEGGKHHCSIKPDHPMPGATYCEWNYARGYADGLNWRKEHPTTDKKEVLR